MRPNFETCGNEFLNHSANIFSKYVFNGTMRGADLAGLPEDATRPVLITLAGCRELCGTGTAYYTWREASNTITTWVLPIIGLLVQAPFESNQAWQTVLALCRWAGSPIAALSYLLWNIKITGKCALMVDMATRFDEYPEQGSEFSRMRDSLFILCIMNQYSAKPSIPPVEAERLLRLTLFSGMLPLDGDSLVKRRTEMAQAFREGRKKGVVPVFVSFLWFVFTLALSIQLAFDDIGGNATAHNLAIGLLVGWLPILILASTVDRNLVSSDSIRNRLNWLIDDVRLALLDPQILQTYMSDTNTTEEDFAWTSCLSSEEFCKGFFTGFGGQGRKHWHYGVAHPILAGIETKFMAEYGRDWLRHAHAARQAIVVGSRNVNGLKMFDPRMIWQITSALFIVCGSVGGAFVLSYFTPTVGLGCRSGGYLVYFVISVALLVTELAVWWLTHETTHTSKDILARVGKKLAHHRSFREHDSVETGGRMSQRARAFLHWFRTNTFRSLMKNCVIRPCEIANTVWLTYIIFAQTFGAYQTCDCLAKMWAGEGGYINFRTADYYTAHGVYYYWGVATALSLTVLTIGLAYIVEEYCTQAHLSTETYACAMEGLRSVRWFKRHTSFVRVVLAFVLKKGKWAWWRVNGGTSERGRRSLVWRMETKQRLLIP